MKKAEAALGLAAIIGVAGLAAYVFERKAQTKTSGPFGAPPPPKSAHMGPSMPGVKLGTQAPAKPKTKPAPPPGATKPYYPTALPLPQYTDSVQSALDDGSFDDMEPSDEQLADMAAALGQITPTGDPEDALDEYEESMVEIADVNYLESAGGTK